MKQAEENGNLFTTFFLVLGLFSIASRRHADLHDLRDAGGRA